jgi:cysteine desulfuration protein SufE
MKVQKNSPIKLDFPQIVNPIIMAGMNPSYEDKQAHVKHLFSACHTPDQKYEKIIEIGRKLPPLDPSLMTDAHRVKGCQSRMYLSAKYLNGRVFFELGADALISAGLGGLLLSVYQGETPETILSCPPRFLEELQIHQHLSPSRSHGLSSLLLRMKQEALRFITSKEAPPLPPQ